MMNVEAELDAPAMAGPGADPGGRHDPEVLRLPARALLLVAGVPGAGKTTMLAHVDTRGSKVLDADPIRARRARRLGRLPYRLWRPLVHGEHYLRVLLALPGPDGLVVHEPGTRGWMRRLLLRCAARSGRSAHLLLLDVTLDEALAGQRQRRRMLHRSAFGRHWRRWLALRPRADRLTEEGWSSVRLLDRAAADRLRRIETG